jgi:hypothetical protein
VAFPSLIPTRFKSAEAALSEKPHREQSRRAMTFAQAISDVVPDIPLDRREIVYRG